MLGQIGQGQVGGDRSDLIVRGQAQACPEPDWFMSVYLRLISDERGLLSILGPGNIWPPYSDDPARERIPFQV